MPAVASEAQLLDDYAVDVAMVTSWGSTTFRRMTVWSDTAGDDVPMTVGDHGEPVTSEGLVMEPGRQEPPA